MSVIKSKRSISEMEFFNNALSLRRGITTLLLRDFGVKDKFRSVKYFEHMAKMNDEDKKALEVIYEKYNIVKISEEWPQWVLQKMRDNLYEISGNIVRCVVAGNSIYPTNLDECSQRRELQNSAIYYCQIFLVELQYIASVLPVNYEKLIPYIEKVEKEIVLLKSWRKSDNRITTKIKNKGNESK